MMPYELWPAAPEDNLNSAASGNLVTLSTTGTLTVETPNITFCDFPAPLATYHEDELFLHHTGNILHLPGGQLFTTLYGKFDGDTHFCSFAVVSNDGGFTWFFRSIIATGDDVPDAPEGPNESDTQLLDNGDLICIYRVSSEREFYKSYSWDEGLTWSTPMRLLGMRSVQPRLAKLGNGAIVLTGGRPGLFCWLNADGKGETWEQINLGTHHNQLIESTEHQFPEAFCQAEEAWEPYKTPSSSTAYTGIMPWGEDKVIVTYDRLGNGWSGAPGPNGKVDRVFTLSLKISI